MKRGRGETASGPSRGQTAGAGPSLSRRHQLVLKARESLDVDGVLHVDSFDDQEVLVETELGVMHVRGDGLNIKELNLSSGSLILTGTVRSLEYSSDGPRKKGRGKGFFSRLLR